jgi:hypothetical protein
LHSNLPGCGGLSTAILGTRVRRVKSPARTISNARTATPPDRDVAGGVFIRSPQRMAAGTQCTEGLMPGKRGRACNAVADRVSKPSAVLPCGDRAELSAGRPCIAPPSQTIRLVTLDRAPSDRPMNGEGSGGLGCRSRLPLNTPDALDGRTGTRAARGFRADSRPRASRSVIAVPLMCERRGCRRALCNFPGVLSTRSLHTHFCAGEIPCSGKIFRATEKQSARAA